VSQNAGRKNVPSMNFGWNWVRYLRSCDDLEPARLPRCSWYCIPAANTPRHTIAEHMTLYTTDRATLQRLKIGV